MPPSSSTLSVDWAYYVQTLSSGGYIKGLIACCTWFASLTGIAIEVYAICLCLCVVDMVLGTYAAIRQGRFSLRIFQRGVMKFIVYGVYILVAAAVQIVLSRTISIEVPMVGWIIAYLGANDALSIMANARNLGWPMPKLFQTIIVRVNHGVEKQAMSALDAIDTKDTDEHNGYCNVKKR